MVVLLVVMAVIGLLLAIAMPAVQNARETARRAQCLNNLHLVGVAVHAYHDKHDLLSQDGFNGYACAACLLPQLDQSPLYEQINRQIRRLPGAGTPMPGHKPHRDSQRACDAPVTRRSPIWRRANSAANL